MNDQPTPFFRILIVMACLVIVVLGLRAGSSIVTPILFTFIIALFAVPLQLALIRMRVPPVLAFLGVFALTAILIVLTLFAFSVLGAAVEASLVEYQEKVAVQVDNLTQMLAQRGIVIDTSTDLTAVEDQVFDAAGFVLSQLAASLGNAFLVIMILFFLLMDAPNILGRISNSPGAQTPLFQNALAYSLEVRASLYRFTAVNLAQAIYIAVFLSLMQVEFALLWGLLAFVLLFIPVAGLLMAAAPPIFVAFALYGLTTAIIVAVGIIAVPFLFQHFMRRYLPSRENISLLVVFFALAFSAWIFGLPGLLLAVPLVVMTRIIFESFPETRWAAILISGRQQVPPPPPPQIEQTPDTPIPA